MDDDTPEARDEYLRGVAEKLRGIANQLRFDLRRADQLRALADGFDRMASRLEREAGADLK